MIDGSSTLDDTRAMTERRLWGATFLPLCVFRRRKEVAFLRNIYSDVRKKVHFEIILCELKHVSRPDDFSTEFQGQTLCVCPSALQTGRKKYYNPLDIHCVSNDLQCEINNATLDGNVIIHLHCIAFEATSHAEMNYLAYSVTTVDMISCSVYCCTL